MLFLIDFFLLLRKVLKSKKYEDRFLECYRKYFLGDGLNLNGSLSLSDSFLKVFTWRDSFIEFLLEFTKDEKLIQKIDKKLYLQEKTRITSSIKNGVDFTFVVGGMDEVDETMGRMVSMGIQWGYKIMWDNGTFEMVE